MLLVDDILLSPVKGITWIFRQIHELAEEELAGEADRLRESLTELYMMLETGEISEAEFEEREKQLLDRLDALDEEEGMIGEADGPDDEESEGDNEESSVDSRVEPYKP